MANRYVKDNRPGVKPVTRVELNDSNNKRKFIVFILVVLVALVSFGYGIVQLLNEPAGWSVIEANSATGDTSAGNFTLNYYLGATDQSPTAQKKAITLVYTSANEQAFKMFNVDSDFEDVVSVHYINNHPNEEIVVDEYLYNSFKLLKDENNRNIYLGPVYSMYDDIFYVTDEAAMIYYDPFVNEEVKDLYNKVAQYASNENMIDIQLLSDNKIKLYVNQEYIDFIKENGLDSYIDFFWMKNAFIVDYLAESLIEAGHPFGTISSFDGFVRSMYDEEIVNQYSAFDLNDDGNVYQAVNFAIEGKVSLVYFHNYQTNTKDSGFVRTLEDGSVRNSYLSIEDGLQRNSLENLIVYDADSSVTKVMLKASGKFISHSFETEDALALKNEGLDVIYFEDNVAYYTDRNITIISLFSSDSLTYTAQLVN